MNLAINNYCNSRCPYCFAGNMGIDKNSSISIDNFRKILSLMEQNGDTELCIFGGEPTLHPKFDEIIDLVCKSKRERYFEFVLLTNGVKLSQYAKILPADTSLLININDDELCLSKKLLAELIDSLDIVTKLFDFRSYNAKNSFGCNLYIEKSDYSYFWQLVDKYRVSNVRVSVTTPKNNEYINDRDTYFIKMKPIFMDFIKEAVKRGLNVSLDCSQIPWCYFNFNDRMLLKEISSERTQRISYCTSDFIVLPDMTMTSCFGSKDFKKCKRKFKNIDDIYTNYKEIKTINGQTRMHNYMSKCKDCIYRISDECHAGCLGFK